MSRLARASSLYGPLCLVASILSACGPQDLPAVQRPAAASVPLDALLTEPQSHHGSWVRTSGWCRIEFEGNALYVDKADFDARRTARAVWLTLGWPVSEATRRLDGTFVAIEGRFVAGRHGHEGAFPAMLTDIREMTTRRAP